MMVLSLPFWNGWGFWTFWKAWGTLLNSIWQYCHTWFGEATESRRCPSWNFEGVCSPELVWKSGSAEHTGLLWWLGRGEQDYFFRALPEASPPATSTQLGLLRSQFKDYKIMCLGACSRLPWQLYPLPLMLNPPGVTL